MEDRYKKQLHSDYTISNSHARLIRSSKQLESIGSKARVKFRTEKHLTKKQGTLIEWVSSRDFKTSVKN